MRFKDRTTSEWLGMVGSIAVPLFYTLPLIIWRDPDALVFALGPFGIILWLVQWVGYVFGGWALSIVFAIIFLAIFGYLAGRLIGWIMSKVAHRG